MKGRLEGKVAFVTGCSACGPGISIGKAIAVALAREGALVFGIGRRREALEETKNLIEGEGGVCKMAEADVTRSDQVKDAIAECISHFGRIDILVNNVGVTGEGGPVECTEAQWKQDMDTNVTSMFLTCKYMIPNLEKAGRGSIINIGSISGVRSVPHDSITYQTSKSAILGLSRGIALRYANKGVRSNVVIVGIMNTPILEQSAGGNPISSFDRNCPMGHTGSPWDVANAVVYLASDESEYVTGTELTVDGGLTAKMAFDL